MSARCLSPPHNRMVARRSELTQLCDEQLACVLAADSIGHIDVRSTLPLAV